MENKINGMDALNGAIEKVRNAQSQRDALKKEMGLKASYARKFDANGDLQNRLQKVYATGDRLSYESESSARQIAKLQNDFKELADAAIRKYEESQQRGLVGDAVGSIMGTAESIIGSATDITAKAVGVALNQASNIVECTTDVASGLMNTATDAASTIVSTSTNVASGLVQNTATMAEKLTSTSFNALGTLLGGGKESGQNSEQGQGISSLVSGMVGNTTNLASNLLGSAQGISSSLMNSASGIVGSLGLDAQTSQAVVQGAASGLASTFLGPEAGGLLVGALTSGQQIPVLGNIGGLFGDASNAIQGGGNPVDVLKNLTSNVTDGLGGLASNILGGSGDMVKNIADAAGNIASNILGSQGDFASGMLSTVGDVAKNILGTSSDVCGNLVGGVGDIASSLLGSGGDVIGNLTDFAQDALGGALDLANAGVDAAMDLASGVVDAAMDLGSSLWDTAKDIASGVVDAASDLMDSLFGDGEEDAEEAIYEAQEGADEIEEGAEESEEELSEDENEDDEEDVQEPFDWGEEDEDEENEDESESTTTPQSASNGADDNTDIDTKSSVDRKSGWKSTQIDTKDIHGLMGLMHEGDQQLFNPYGHSTGGWTCYSFRPKDTLTENSADNYPQIAITPASFQSLDSMNKMLDNIPFVVIKEYFFKSTASTMINFVENIMKTVQDAKDAPKDESSQGAAGAKSTGNGFLDKIKNTFVTSDISPMVIDIPYILYCGLRKKVFGNTYIFPYLVTESTIINSASNHAEWEKGNNPLNFIKDLISNTANMIGGMATTALGMQAAPADLFPAPSWSLKDGDKPKFDFDLMLLNDNAVTARNNYMCVNTIINNNRSIQKGILAFPGALYELWLPTGQRHLMCTASFQLSPLGLNRKAPKNFFKDAGVQGANFEIGTEVSKKIENKHDENIEVIPDGYKLHCEFQSCLSNNLNTSVFQYYVKMTSLADANSQAPGSNDVPTAAENTASKVVASAASKVASAVKSYTSSKNARGNTRLLARAFSEVISEIVDDDENSKEKFEESTYNKRLQTLKSQFGDMAVNSEGAVGTILSAQKTIRESTEFLSKLYNAPNNNLWFKPLEKEEYLTTLKSDYKQILRKRYQEKFSQVKDVDLKVKSVSSELSKATDELARYAQTNLKERDRLLLKKLEATKELEVLKSKRDEIVDELMQIDTDIVQTAFDEQDDAVSVKKTELTPMVFKQVWNEKIMNSYEKDKIQYMTSKERENYFKEKLREIGKFDKYGVLSHDDWFFRVAVMDFVTSEMKRLVSWFKDCSFDDFETIYKIVRKLNLLQTDVDQARMSDSFNINRTNLFNLSDKDMKGFKSLDGLLTGNTLYELFKSNTVAKNIKSELRIDDANDNGKNKGADLVLVKEQTSEQDIADRRKIRSDIVIATWGSEAELTKAAYARIKDDEELREKKERIMELKISNSESEELQTLLSEFTATITALKERMVMDRMGENYETSSNAEKTMDEVVNSKVIDDEEKMESSSASYSSFI